MSNPRTFVLNIVSPSAPTALSTLAASLAPGQYSTALGDTGLTQTQIDAIVWVNRFFYDGTRKKALLTSEQHGSPTPQWGCYYDEATNTWTYAGDSVADGNGHVYESQAFDPSDNKLYRCKYYDNDLQVLSVGTSLNTWATVTPPWTGSGFGTFADQGCASAAWHPNLFGPGDGGVVVVADNAATGMWVAWRRATQTWHNVPGATWTPTTTQYGHASYFSSLMYSPGGDFLMGGTPTNFGAATGGAWFTLGAGSGGTMATATRIVQPPIDCLANAGNVNVGCVIADPAGSAFPYILEKAGTLSTATNSRVWKWNGSAWTLKAYSHPFNFVSGSSNWCVCSVTGKGVFWGKAGLNAASSPSRVWRPND